MARMIGDLTARLRAHAADAGPGGSCEYGTADLLTEAADALGARSVWVVFEGEYSDVHVAAVFSSEAAAIEFRGPESDSYGAREVREFPVDPEFVPYLELRCYVFPDGVESEVEILRMEVDPDQRAQGRYHPNLNWSTNNPRHMISVTVEGSDLARVRKAYTERVAYCRAQFDQIISAYAAYRDGSMSYTDHVARMAELQPEEPA